MKYTFEIMKEYEDAFRGISVYSVSEDKKLMVDFVALEELEDAQKEIDEAYQRGLHEGNDIGYKDGVNDGRNEAWEAARKIAQQWEEDSDTEHRLVIDDSISVTLDSMTASEAIEKLKAYEKQKAENEIKVRDEVVWTGDEDVVIVVTRVYTVNNIEWCDGVGRDGKVYQILTEHASKTGRHFDIDKILEEMRHD